MDKHYQLYNLDRAVTVLRLVRIAGRSQDRRKGLLGVTDLELESGLWICPCEAVHTFGMRIALDVLFLDRAYRVKKIAHRVQANRIAFCFSASSVVELGAGLVSSTGTRVNDQLEFREL